MAEDLFHAGHRDRVKDPINPAHPMPGRKIIKLHPDVQYRGGAVDTGRVREPCRDGEEFVKKINDEGGVGVVAAKMFPGAHLVRGFNAIGSGGLEKNAHRTGEPLG